MSKRRRLPKRLFPARLSASFIPTPRIDHNKAAAYNQQRSKATVGGRSDTQHKPDNSFMQEIPQTFTRYGKRFYNPDDGQWFMSKRGEVIERKHELLIMEAKDLLGLYRVWQSGLRHQGVSEWFCITVRMVESLKYKLMVFFSGGEYLFIQESGDTRFISRIYQRNSDLKAEVKIRVDTMQISWTIVEQITGTV